MTDDNQNIDPPGDDTGDNNTTTPPPGSVDWEARYKSLQSVQEKKRQKLEQQITDLTTKNEQAIADFNEKKEAVEAFEKQQATYLKEKGDLEGKLQTALAEQTKLNQKVMFQKVILDEFSDLSEMIEYVPAADTEEGVRANASAFRAKQKKYAEAHLKNVMEGAGGPPSGATNTATASSEEEAIWKRIYATAGIAGKEEEYQKAYTDLQDFLARKNK